MKKIKILKALLLGPLLAGIDRLKTLHSSPFNRRPVPLANSLGLMNNHGIESLLVDPASTSLPFANRYLLIQRGATGYQYGDVCAGGPGGALPLGPSSDSPYAVGDVLNVRRLGARPGLEIGIGVAGKTVTIDKLLVSAAGGCVQDVSTLTVNGTYWAIGRAAATITAAGSLMEVAYVPCEPFQLVNTGGTLTFPPGPA